MKNRNCGNDWELVELPSYMEYLKKSTDYIYNYSFNDNNIILYIVTHLDIKKKETVNYFITLLNKIIYYLFILFYYFIFYFIII